MKVFVCILILLTNGLCSAGTFTYGRGTDDADDNYIGNLADTSSNHGNDFVMFVRPGSIEQKTMFRFSAIDSDISGETIDSARLTFTIRFTVEDHTIYAHRIDPDRDWVENQTTWNVYKTSNDWGTAGASNTTTDILATATDSENAYDNGSDYDVVFDVVDDVQAWADGDDNQGWLLIAGTPGTAQGGTQIWGANWFSSPLRPYLEIWSTTPTASSGQVIIIE